MQPLDKAFDQDSVRLMGQVCDAAWREVIKSPVFISEPARQEARRLMVERLMAAVVDGERNPERLRTVALNGAYE
jgi:hypothetical protein